MIKKLFQLLLGFILIAIGIILMKETNLGMNPWNTFHYGLSLKTGLAFGTISQLVGLFFILLSLFFRMYPGIGTLLNMLLIGYFVNILDGFIDLGFISSLPVRILLCLVGLTIFSYGVYLYLFAGLGAGPRDGFMIGIMKKTGRPVSYVKTAMEAVVFALGIWLGAPFGIGSILTTFLGGPLLGFIFKLHHYDPKAQSHVSFKEFFCGMNLN